MAEIFQVSVSELLGVQERESVLTEAGKVRGYILMLAFAAIVLAAIIKNTVGALIATAICGIAALLVLYHNLGLLTSVTTSEFKLKPLKITTIFNITIIAVCAVLALLVQIDFVKMAENGEKFTAALIVSRIIFFSGYIAPKLPFNRHTGDDFIGVFLEKVSLTKRKSVESLGNKALHLVGLCLIDLEVGCIYTEFD